MSSRLGRDSRLGALHDPEHTQHYTHTPSLPWPGHLLHFPAPGHDNSICSRHSRQLPLGHPFPPDHYRIYRLEGVPPQPLVARAGPLAGDGSQAAKRSPPAWCRDCRLADPSKGATHMNVKQRHAAGGVRGERGKPRGLGMRGARGGGCRVHGVAFVVGVMNKTKRRVVSPSSRVSVSSRRGEGATPSARLGGSSGRRHSPPSGVA